MQLRIPIFTILMTAGMFSYGNIHKTDSIPVQQKDVSSADAIINALYEVISGPPGEKRNWDRMRTLFVSEARMTATGRKPDSTYGKRSMTIEEYIAASGPFLEKDGFFEKEISKKTEQYGGVVHVFSTYESRKKADDPSPFMRGINSIQLWNDGKRWWIISIFWQSENKSEPIPQKYLN
jgi:hypothetical protein